MLHISNNLKLQSIRIEDHQKLLALITQIYPPAYAHLWINKNCEFYFNKFYSLKNLNLEQKNTNSAYYFVVYKGVTVGIFRLIYNMSFPDLPNHNATYIDRIYLSKDAQGKGIADLLFNWSYKKARDKGCRIIWLKAMDTQQQALRFYEKQHFNLGRPAQLDFELMHPHLRGMCVMYKRLD